MSITACETLNVIFLMSLQASKEAWHERLFSYLNIPVKDLAVEAEDGWAWGAPAEQSGVRNQPLPSESSAWLRVD